MQNIGPNTPKSPLSKDQEISKPSDKHLLGTEPPRTVTQIKEESTLKIPQTIPNTPGPTLQERTITQETSQEKVVKDSKKVLKEELKAKANAISPEMKRKIDVILRQNLSEDALKIIQKKLNLIFNNPNPNTPANKLPTKYLNEIYYISSKIEIISRRNLDNTTLEEINQHLETLVLTNPYESKAKEYINELFCPSLIKQNIKLIPKEEQKKIFINERSRFIANLLINNEGIIDIELIDIIKDLLNTPPLYQSFSKTHNQLLLKTLDDIQSNPILINLLNNLDEPGKTLSGPKKQNLESIIKTTLGLEKETELTAMHSKQAVLSALLSDIRQGQMGSCFATALAIMIHDQNPLQAAQDLKTMIETGQLEKVVNGKTIIFHIPKIHIPTLFGRRLLFNEQGFIGIKRFLQMPGLQKAIKLAGLDITKEEDNAKLTKMLNDVLEKIPANPEKSGDILRGFMNQLAMHHKGLEHVDFENIDNYDQLIQQLKLLEQKRQTLPQTMKEKGHSESEINFATSTLTNSINDLHEQLKEMSLNFDKKFGINSQIRDQLNAYEDFKQLLEINFMAAEGENSLLRSWEYAIATHGRSKDEYSMAHFQNLLTSKITESSWDKFFNKAWSEFAIWLRDWLGIEIETETTEARVAAAAERVGIIYILDHILDKIEDTKDLNKKEFLKEFNKNFKTKLNERLQARFEGGHFQLYDKTRASDAPVPLETPEAICETILSIADHAMDNINIDLSIKDEIYHQLKLVIQGRDNTDPRKSEFLTNLMLAYTYTKGIIKIKENEPINSDKLIAQFMTFEGGATARILSQYTEIALKPIKLDKNPAIFISELVTQIRKMIRNDQLDPINNGKEIMFPMSGSQHDFLLRPDMAMLNEAMKASDIKEWITKNIINDGKIFIVADLNWQREAEHASLAIKWDKETNKFKFILVTESIQGPDEVNPGARREFALPSYDENHNFGDKGFTVLFLEKQIV